METPDCPNGHGAMELAAETLRPISSPAEVEVTDTEVIVTVTARVPIRLVNAAPRAEWYTKKAAIRNAAIAVAGNAASYVEALPTREELLRLVNDPEFDVTT